MASYQIGVHQFVSLYRLDDPAGPPLGPREQCLTINRPGVDGTAIMKIGRRCDPFPMRACVDCLTDALVPTAIRTYQTLIGESPQDILWRNIDYGAILQCKWVVLDVQLLSARKLAAKAGGLVSGATAWIETIWTLQPVLTQ